MEVTATAAKEMKRETRKIAASVVRSRGDAFQGFVGIAIFAVLIAQTFQLF